jgi:amino acid adenylation domain-containing protein
MYTYLLHHLLRDSAGRFPNNEAVVLNEKSIMYSELEARSNQLASALTRMGVRVGDRVGIVLNKSIEAIISLFGILKTGAAYVPIDPLAPGRRVKYIINHCEIKLLVTSSVIANKIISDVDSDSSLEKVLLIEGDVLQLTNQPENVIFLLWDELLLDNFENFQPLNFSDTNPAYILHTSGSTGLPKGVVISHLNSLAFVNMAARFFEISENDRLSCHAPFHFDLSVFDIFVAVKNGATIVLVPEIFSIFPLKLAQFIDDSKISVWNSVASVLSLLAKRCKLDDFGFDTLRLIIFSGEVLPVKYLRQLMIHMRKAQFFNVYGQTEANSSTFYKIEEVPDDDVWRIPIGRAFPNFEVFALNEGREIITAPGEMGELYVNSSSIASGYWGDTEMTSETFVQDPRPHLRQNKIYRTGDLVKIDDNGNYVFLGRKDRQVKSRGYRIQLNEIELILNSHGGINEAVVIAVPDELIGNRIISYVIPGDGMQLTEKEILRHCSTLLPAYMVPEKITFVERFPKTATGKIDRKLLEETACGLI